MLNNEASNNKNIKDEDNKYKYKILLIILTLTLICVGIFATYAFFQTQGRDSQNEIVDVQVGNMELIFSDGNNGFNKALNFGESAEKTFTIKNNGTVDTVAKINWKNLNNKYLYGSLTYSLSYYERDGDTPTVVVTDKNVPKNDNPFVAELANGLIIPLQKTYTFILTIKLNDLPIDQTSDLDATLSTEFSIEEGTIKKYSNAEVLLNKANDVSITDYNSGNKVEMFTFMHPEAEQTTGWTETERIDYRYIGDTPNNYIQFNNETWRIIGVFTVEGIDGKKEQRIKIIRNESIGKLVWNSGINEWPASSLYTLLNSGDYYNRNLDYTINGLSPTAKSQISSTKWYLGGSSEFSWLYATSEKDKFEGTKFYTFERSKYPESNNNTIADIGLMYPSDYIYTYSNGVDNICFTDASRCHTQEGATPTSSWLFNSKMPEWTITPYICAGTYECVPSAFSIQRGGDIFGSVLHGSNVFTYSFVHSDYEVRPTVYLRSDIEIISGTGAQDNMYILTS